MPAVRMGSALCALALLAVACSDSADTGLPSKPTPEPPPKTAVRVIDSAFEPKELSIAAGETVTWSWVGSAPHNVKFTSIPVNSHPNCVPAGTGCSSAGAAPFRHEFPSAGSFLYYCVVHGTAEGAGMAGTVVVK